MGSYNQALNSVTFLSSIAMRDLVLILATSLLSHAAVWDLELCKNREKHWTHDGHNYIYSGQSDLLASEEKKVVTTGDKEANLTAVVRDRSGAGDWCQKRCMDLVSLETEEEWRLVRTKMEAAGAKFIWTSGHICDRAVGQRCFTDATLQPRLVNGWFWSGSGAKIPPPTRRLLAGERVPGAQLASSHR